MKCVEKNKKAKTIGERIKFLREKNKISLTELAEITGIKKSGISSYENDLYDPSAKALISLSNVFNVSVDWLLTGKDYYYDLDIDFWIEYNSLRNNDKKELRSFINYLKYKNEIGDKNE